MWKPGLLEGGGLWKGVVCGGGVLTSHELSGYPEGGGTEVAIWFRGGGHGESGEGFVLNHGWEKGGAERAYIWNVFASGEG